jgi:alpha-L-fucosidase
MVISLATIMVIVLVQCTFGQEAGNYAVIKPGDSPTEIIRKAANITPSPRQLAWQQQECIAFAHFGMNTFMDQEWGKGTESPSVFNPTNFDARQWVRVIKDAGFKLLILTAKHHDGFCLWPSKYTEHSVKNSPWKSGKGDVVAEVAKACREAGLKFGVYLSPWDRHERTYGDSPVYNEHFRNQLRELLSNYGEIAEVWFDGANGEGPNGKTQVYDWQSYYKLIRELQPNAVIAIMGPDVRWVGTESGSGRETEWSVLPNVTQNLDAIAASSQQFPIDGAFAPKDLMGEDLGSREKMKNASSLVWYPAETDVSIRPGWFYHASQDALVKTPEQLVDIYFSSVGRNSVLLLNIPPDKSGRIHDSDMKNLMGMRKILDETFRKNLALGARMSTSNERRGHRARTIVEPGTKNYWTTDDGVESATLEIQLTKQQTFDCALLQENISVGQRVESFRLEAFSNNEWKVITRGTTIGYKRLLRFPAMTTMKVRLIIEQSRNSPTLSSFGLFKAPPLVALVPPEGAFERELSVGLNAGAADAQIYYTLDGSIPTKASYRYSGPIHLDKSTTITAVTEINGEFSPRSSSGRYVKSLSVRSVSFEKPYSPKYPAHGDSTIIDGRRGTLDFRDNRWLGFSGDDFAVTLDLGTPREVHGISIGFLQQQGSWIFLPTTIQFAASIDGINWHHAGAVQTAVTQSEAVLVRDFSPVWSKQSCRFVKIRATNVGVCPPWHPGAGDKAWLFVDEVIVD